jgi:hypothetical protein
VFKEIRRLLDSTQDMKIKHKYLENVPEERLDIDG